MITKRLEFRPESSGRSIIAQALCQSYKSKLYLDFGPYVSKIFKKEFQTVVSFFRQISEYQLKFHQNLWARSKPTVTRYIETAYEIRENTKRLRPKTATETLP